VLFKSSLDAEGLLLLAPYTRQMHAVGGRATAYVCENFTCREPLTDTEALKIVLGTPVA
jgi:uncharacterized protein YyaL (SSP411 family)